MATMHYKPLVCDEMDRSIQLCNGIAFLIDDFKREIHCLESSKLYRKDYQAKLEKIADCIEELIHHLTYFATTHHKECYFYALHGIIKSLNNAPNVFIITSHYLDPDRPFRRLLNKHTFSHELGQTIKKITFTKQILEKLSQGRKSGINARALSQLG